jgi:membrane protease YdiL (CAAX protease family)
MDVEKKSNTPPSADIFSAVNNYFLLFFCASCVLSSIYIQQLFYLVGQYRVGIGVSSVFGIILPAFLLTRRFPAGFRGQLRIMRPRTHRLIMVAVATCAAVVLVDEIYVINQRFSPVPEDYAEAIRELRPDGALAFTVTLLGLCLLVPLAEEVVFRGLIQRIFTRNMGPVVGVALAGAVFGAVHLNAHLLISITAFGWFLGFLYQATGNLTYPIIAHAIFNSVALVQLMTDATVEGGNLPVYLRDVWIVVASLVLIVFFIAKIREGGSESEPPSEEAEATVD